MSQRGEISMELRCPACRWSQVCPAEAMANWLRAVGKLRPNRQVEEEILVEVFRASVPQFACPQCGQRGLTATPVAEGSWPGPVRCEGCGKAIPRQRVAALPGVRLCAACQQAVESGDTEVAGEYCPRCGARMKLTLSRSAGVTRYELACTAIPPCRRA